MILSTKFFWGDQNCDAVSFCAAVIAHCFEEVKFAATLCKFSRNTHEIIYTSYYFYIYTLRYWTCSYCLYTKYIVDWSKCFRFFEIGLEGNEFEISSKASSKFVRLHFFSSSSHSMFMVNSMYNKETFTLHFTHSLIDTNILRIHAHVIQYSIVKKEEWSKMKWNE